MELAHYNSPIGWLELCARNGRLVRVRKVDDPASPIFAKEGLLAETTRQLIDYFNRRRTDFDLPLDLSDGTPFYQSVWQELLKIPYGHTTSYSAIAKTLGQPDAVRAVGMANRNNPIAIIVPCHRVIAKNGDLQGYFYGLDVKMQLLQIENPMSFGEQGTLF
jgi:methylated-DNA-[protein]-cysteine S-methyltransferase